MPIAYHSGQISVNNGESILCCDENRTFDFENLELALQAGSVVLIRHADNITRVVNLYDEHKNSVNIQTGRENFFLRPGQECIIASSEQSLKACKRIDGSARRCSVLSSSNGNTFAICELSIPSLLKYHPLAAQLYKSGDKHDRKVAGKVLKMAACLEHFTKSYAAYSPEN